MQRSKIFDERLNCDKTAKGWAQQQANTKASCHCEYRAPWQAVAGPNASIEPSSFPLAHVAFPPADAATDRFVVRSHISQLPSAFADSTVKELATPDGIVDEAISSVPSLSSTIALTTALLDRLWRLPSAAGDPSHIRSSYGVTSSTTSRTASHCKRNGRIVRGRLVSQYTSQFIFSDAKSGLEWVKIELSAMVLQVHAIA